MEFLPHISIYNLKSDLNCSNILDGYVILYMQFVAKVYQKCSTMVKRNDWLDKVIEASRRQSISFTLLILKGFFGADELYPSFGCLLGRMMLSMSFSQGFLPELLYVMHADTEMNIFETTIMDCLSYVRVAAQLNHSKSEYVIRPLYCLKDRVIH